MAKELLVFMGTEIGPRHVRHFRILSRGSRTLVQANIGFVSKKPLEKLDVLIFPLMTWRKPP